MPDLATVDEVEPLSDGTLLYSIATYLRPPFFSRYDEAAARASETKLAQTSPISFADTEVVREFARSKDGTSIPLNMCAARALSSTVPTIGSALSIRVNQSADVYAFLFDQLGMRLPAAGP